MFILSRSGFAGVQRNGVTAWSGDILSNFESFKRQIPAGLNFALSGVPYWTTDIGGFIVGNPDDSSYRELFVRWFEYGSFCPIFRVHGTRTTGQNELWSYGPEAQEILVKYDRLRYELMPYIYSLAWKTTHESYTSDVRPLVMDFRSDVTAQNVGDQFLFGPAILVNPVTEAGGNITASLSAAGGVESIFGPASRAGGGVGSTQKPAWSGCPFTLEPVRLFRSERMSEYATEKPADSIELRVYFGADGDFTLYEDENDNYDYEEGQLRHHSNALGRRERRN